MELSTKPERETVTSEQRLESVMEVLSKLTDPRDGRGKRYSLQSILSLIVMGMLCKKTSLRAIARWGRNQSHSLMQSLGFSDSTPCCATLHRVMSRLDSEELDECIGEWFRATTTVACGEAIALDGKSVRGVEGLHLLAAYAHQSQVVLAQEAVSTKENEITAAPRVLAALELEDRVISADAMFAQRSLSEAVCEAGGDYFWVVKGNQPTLKRDIELLFDAPPFGTVFELSEERSRRAGRDELRRLWASDALNEYSDWPMLHRVCKIQREVRCKGKVTAECAYAITSLASDKAAADRLMQIWREHWRIENGLHWTRDVVFGEDRSRIRKGHAPRVCATLRNLTLGLLRKAGVTEITAALERHADRPDEALALIVT